MHVVIETIPHKNQAYPTVGDWRYETDEQGKPVLRIRVSEMGDWRHEFLVALHEMVEAHLCEKDGITPQAVDTFDKQFEADRAEGKHGPADEPGDDANAPYRKQHGIASGIERIVGAEMNVDWNEYANEVESL